MCAQRKIDALRAERPANLRVLTFSDKPTNKPHGLREAYILDGDGYVWVPDVHSLSKWSV